MIKKMWAKEIAHYWFQDITRRQKNRISSIWMGQASVLLPRIFPDSPKAKVIKILNNLPELHIHDSDEKYSWIWLCERRTSLPGKGKILRKH